jgi:hypothetical protein
MIYVKESSIDEAGARTSSLGHILTNTATSLEGLDKSLEVWYNHSGGYMQHGGLRAGAGRPRSITRTGKENELVSKKLKGGAQAGWEVLADEYPSLIRLAVDFAKGDVDGKPNPSMLKTLLELMPKVVGTDADAEDATVIQLVRELRATITPNSTNNAEEPSLGVNSFGDSPPPTNLRI